jgi:superfamily I DNA and/or RNA helicase
MLKVFEIALQYEDVEIKRQLDLYYIKKTQIYQAELEANRYYFVLEKGAGHPPGINQLKIEIKKSKSTRLAYITSFEKETRRVYFENASPWLKKDVIAKSSFSIGYLPNRINFRTCYNAIETLKRFKNDYLWAFDPQPVTPKKAVEISAFYEKRIDEEQKLAVEKIVNCLACPQPLLIDGATGTGKTTVLVESVLQILKNRPNEKIVICAGSNAQCDEIANRILGFNSAGKLLRFYSNHVVHGANKISEKLLGTSNLRDLENHLISCSEIDWFNVIVMTFVCAHKLSRTEQKNFRFDHILIDDAATAIEIETIIPIYSFASIPGLPGDAVASANIVLFGDTRQLAPVIHTQMAENLKLGK